MSKKKDTTTQSTRRTVVAGAGDEVPYAWRNPLVDLEKDCKMTKVLRNIKKGEADRECLLPIRTEE